MTAEREALAALLELWDSYQDSDLSQMNAHDCLVRYEVWNRARQALANPATGDDAELENALAPKGEVVMSEWQPIATAPKDGAVLVWDDRERSVFLVEKRGSDGSCWQGDWDWQLPNPTRWMPLPDPPDMAQPAEPR